MNGHIGDGLAYEYSCILIIAHTLELSMVGAKTAQGGRTQGQVVQGESCTFAQSWLSNVLSSYPPPSLFYFCHAGNSYLIRGGERRKSQIHVFHDQHL